MAIRHNLKPEVVPKILEVLEDPTITQAYGRLADSPTCLCFEGVVCEAYRRAHPDKAEWIDVLGDGEDIRFRLKETGNSHTCLLPIVVERWACSPMLCEQGWAQGSAFADRYGQMHPADGLNDSRNWPLKRFAEALRG